MKTTAIIVLLSSSLVSGGPFLVTDAPKFTANVGTSTVPASPRLTPPPALADSHPRVGTVHSHTCRVCNTTWSHTDTSFGNRADHSCPSCGKVEWQISATPALQLTQKQSAALTNCPGGGNCPLSSPRTRRYK